MELGDSGLEHQANARAARDVRAGVRPDHVQTGSWGGLSWPHGALPCQPLRAFDQRVASSKKRRHADQSHSIGFKSDSLLDCKVSQRGGMPGLVSLASFGASSARVVLSGFTNSPAPAPPIAPATAPSVPPTNTPTGPATAAPTAAPAAEPATKPPPIRTDFDSRSASSGSRAT